MEDASGDETSGRGRVEEEGECGKVQKMTWCEKWRRAHAKIDAGRR